MHDLIYTLTAALILLAAVARAEEQMIFDPAALPSLDEARRKWTPIHEATPPVGLVTVNGKRMLELPCNFKTNEHWRVGWDLTGNWDLADCREITVDVHPNGERSERMTLYFHTRGGWYRSTFNVPAGGGSITLPRRRFASENSPANWYQIDTLRLAVSRGEAVDRKVHVASIRVRREPVRVALWRGERTNRQLVRRASSRLEDMGISHEIVRDGDIAAGRLRGKKVVLAVAGAGSSSTTAGELKRFADEGGRTLPFTWDDSRQDERKLLDRIAEAWPGLWKDLYERREAALGKVAGCAGVEELRRFVTENARDDAARLAAAKEMMTQARVAKDLAADAMKQQKSREAFEHVMKARELHARALFSSVASRPNEFRAVWCHKPTGVDGMTWDEAMKTLADSGFNAIIVNMSWGYGAAYESKLLPMSDQAEGKDQLAICLAAAKKHGIAVHVWRVNWNLAYRAPKEVRDKLGREGRLQQDPDGKTINWLCPSNPLNRKLEIDAMLEVARNYDVAGIHFDYIRYPGMNGCYCPGCRKRFEEVLGEKVKNWPADVRAGEHREKHLQFRRDNITPVVQAVSRETRKIKPKVKVSAAVFWNWESDRNGVGQDWKLWVEKGWLDFVCPMQYTTDAREFEDMTRRTTEWVGGRIPLFPGIGATLGQEPDDTLRQILTVRKAKLPGFVLFGYYPPLVKNHLPLLRLGPTSRKER